MFPLITLKVKAAVVGFNLDLFNSEPEDLPTMTAS